MCQGGLFWGDGTGVNRGHEAPVLVNCLSNRPTARFAGSGIASSAPNRTNRLIYWGGLCLQAKLPMYNFPTKYLVK